MLKNIKGLLISVTMMVFLSSCFFGTKTQKNYVLLTAKTDYLNDNTTLSEIKGNHSVGLMPVKLAEHLNKENFVEYDAFQQIQYNPSMLWAEPLMENSQHVIAEYLSILLSSNSENPSGSNFKLFPWTVREKPDVIIKIDITRFGYDLASGKFILAGSSTLDTDKGGELQSFSYSIDINRAPENVAKKELEEFEHSKNKQVTLAYSDSLAKLSEDLIRKISEIK